MLSGKLTWNSALLNNIFWFWGPQKPAEIDPRNDKDTVRVSIDGGGLTTFDDRGKALGRKPGDVFRFVGCRVARAKPLPGAAGYLIRAFKPFRLDDLSLGFGVPYFNAFFLKGTLMK